MKRKVMRFTFIIYCFLLAYCLFRREPFNVGKSYFDEILMNINIIPFNSISQYLILLIDKTNPNLFYYALVNFAGNIVAFVPIGIYFPLFWANFRNYLKFIFGAFIIIFVIEIVQLFTLTGSFDVDDLILNLIGASMGYLCYYFMKLHFIKQDFGNI